MDGSVMIAFNLPQANALNGFRVVDILFFEVFNAVNIASAKSLELINSLIGLPVPINFITLLKQKMQIIK